MSTQMMTAKQESDNLWRLRRGEALRLNIGPGMRSLRVREGRVWLTAGNGRADAPGQDVWLAPGEDVLLPSGAEVVAEGWPQASFELIVPPQACAAQ